ncbi:hypothetical protein SAMN05216278_1485 [Halopelagius longus]|uniref:Uncharacterized protein n=1 Tax=Halopelagius longus TaxID=1236180 RepID=A0A1H1ATG8_9EURY|nr:hypothetical protein SAMN05216278_1485 [Halopelagius longus]
MAEPTTGQRRLLYGLFVFAFVVFVLGVVAILFLSGYL